MNRFWIVWNETSKHVTFKHQTELNARAEAERLARNNPHDVFHVLEAIDSCKAITVAWASKSNDDIPF